MELHRTIAVFTLELWKSAESIKESFISDMDTDNHSVKRIPRYPCPVLVRAFEQLRQVRLQAKTPRIFPVSTVISLFQLQKVVMDICKGRQAYSRDAHSWGVRAVGTCMFGDSFSERQRYLCNLQVSKIYLCPLCSAFFVSSWSFTYHAFNP